MDHLCNNAHPLPLDHLISETPPSKENNDAKIQTSMYNRRAWLYAFRRASNKEAGSVASDSPKIFFRPAKSSEAQRLAMALKNLIAKVKSFEVPTSISQAKGLIKLKMPWQITGPCSDPEYENAVPNALDYRPFSPASAPVRVYIPTSEPENVFDIKYFPRDHKRNSKERKRVVLSKSQLEEARQQKEGNVFFFEGGNVFPSSYVMKTQILEDDKLPGNGYE